MKKTLLLTLLLGVMAVGCSRAPIKTREIYFYRTDGLNQGRPVAIDVVYPKDDAEKEKAIREIGFQKWFTSDLYDQVHKDKVWLDNQVVSKSLVNKGKMDPYMVIFAEYGSGAPAVAERGQEAFLLFQKGMKPKAKKVEYIRVHNGSLERLAKKPKE